MDTKWFPNECTMNAEWIQNEYRLEYIINTRWTQNEYTMETKWIQTENRMNT